MTINEYNTKGDMGIDRRLSKGKKVRNEKMTDKELIEKIAHTIGSFYHPHQEFEELSDGIRADLLFFAEEIIKDIKETGYVKQIGEIREIIRAAADPEAYEADGIGFSWERNASTFRAFKDAGYVQVEKQTGGK